jgi:hypothetical protein
MYVLFLSYMYAKLCNIEVLPSYIKEVAVGDILTVQALIANPLDWQHFYEKVSTIKIGDRTDFTVITQEGERVIGFGNIVEVDKWSNRGQYGFKIKITVKKQKSLTDRRIRGSGKVKLSSVQPEKVSDAASASAEAASTIVPPTDLMPAAGATTVATVASPHVTSSTTTTTEITAQDLNSFQKMLKESLTMDITS